MILAERPLVSGQKGRVFLGILMLLVLIAAPLCFGEEHAPEPYGKDEFPKILQDLRRGEIILAGTFPFSLFVTLEAFDIYRYASNDGAQEYAPWPFRSPSSPPYTTDERTIILATALSLSAVIALADYIVGKIVERRAEDRPPPSR